MNELEIAILSGVAVIVLCAPATFAIKSPDAYRRHAQEIRWFLSIALVGYFGFLTGFSVAASGKLADPPISFGMLAFITMASLAYLSVCDRISSR